MVSVAYSHERTVTDGVTILFPVGTARDEETEETHLIFSTFTGVEYEYAGDRHLEVHTGQVIEDYPEQYTARRSHRVADYTCSVAGDDVVFQYYTLPQGECVTQRWYCDDGQWVFETDVGGGEDVTQTEIVCQAAHHTEPHPAVVEEQLLVGESDE